MLTAIVGINWGDEGKGRMVDLLSRDYQVVVRYQGDNSSEHTIITENGHYVLNLLPAGILHPDVTSVMGNGMCIDPAHLTKEIRALYDQGVDITPANLKISDRATVELPYHMAMDRYEAERLGGDARLATGVSYVYGDKSMNLGIRMGDLLHPEYLAKRLRRVMAFKTVVIDGVYRKDPVSVEEILEWATRYGEIFRDYICDTGEFLAQAHAMGKDILFEAPQGALRDVDFGVYPYTCSSSTVAAYATIGGGIPGLKLDHTVGIMKAYSSCTGDCPFPAELTGAEAEYLMEYGRENAQKDGLLHRVGAFDAVASRYGVRMQGANVLALTKLDTLSYMEKIPVCVAYEINGRVTEDFPIGAELEIAKPVIEYVDGWNMDISECRTADDLPVEALTYVKYLEHLVGAHIRYVSVGPEREACILL